MRPTPPPPDRALLVVLLWAMELARYPTRQSERLRVETILWIASHLSRAGRAAVPSDG
jgi:hypothetical protein